jgi:hypothetical protein
MQRPPTLTRHVQQLVGEDEPPRSRSCAFRDPLPQPHGGEAALDRIRRPDVLPVLRGEVEEREQRLLISHERFDCLLVSRAGGRRFRSSAITVPGGLWTVGVTTTAATACRQRASACAPPEVAATSSDPTALPFCRVVPAISYRSSSLPAEAGYALPQSGDGLAVRARARRSAARGRRDGSGRAVPGGTRPGSAIDRSERCVRDLQAPSRCQHHGTGGPREASARALGGSGKQAGRWRFARDARQSDSHRVPSASKRRLSTSERTITTADSCPSLTFTSRRPGSHWTRSYPRKRCPPAAAMPRGAGGRDPSWRRPPPALSCSCPRQTAVRDGPAPGEASLRPHRFRSPRRRR